MMPNRPADILFQLIKSLTKAEKRNFKLYITRNSGNSDLKVIELFNALEKLENYDETQLLKKLNSIKKPQLANIKAHLYKQLLASLRLIKTGDSIDLELHEQLDYAKILYDKGLYLQSLKILERVKEISQQNFQHSYLIQAISLEKKIETLHITRSMQNRAEQLTTEAIEVHERRLSITRLSNLALQLYSWYIKHGHARNEEDEAGIIQFFKENFPKDAEKQAGFYDRLYVYQCYVWYTFIRQDFLSYYKYTQKWVNLFNENPEMVAIETGHYLKGMHNLLNAHYDLRNFRQFDKTLAAFEKFASSAIASQNHNNKIQTFVYLSSARLNDKISKGEFKEALKIVPEVEHGIKEYALFMDRHRVMVFNYKFATLYFGSGNYDKCIDYLRLIINDSVDLRTDLQCYSRLMHLLAHYELGNFDILDSLTRSAYRFMAKMQNFTVVEEEIFRFLRNSFYHNPKQLQPQFQELLGKLKKYEKSRFETRAFAYLDIISWVESKVYAQPISKIINQKYLNNPHR